MLFRPCCLYFSLKVSGDDWWVTGPGLENAGYIIAPDGMEQANLKDMASGNHTFRLGDENDYEGHRGFPGISGWGWLAIEQGDGTYSRTPTSGFDDWIFTVIIPMPGPGLMSVAGLSALAVIRRRRVL